MVNPRFTVVIPAFHSAETLPQVLALLAAQRREVPHTVVVVDDGSGDATHAEAVGAQERYGTSYLTVIAQEHHGAAAARNAGARAAGEPLLLFLGADILPQPHFLRRHASVHVRFPDPSVACVGFVTWDRDIPPTPFMVFLEHGGPQNAYGDIAGTSWVAPEHFCYGANLSLKRGTFEEAGGFAEQEFSRYGWEDLELGIRLARRGIRLYYEPTARGGHMHRVTVADAEHRMWEVGRGARVLQTLHPEARVLNWPRERWVHPLRRWCFPPPLRLGLSWLAERAERRVLLPRLYRRVLSLAFYDGVHSNVDDVREIVDNSSR